MDKLAQHRESMRLYLLRYPDRVKASRTKWQQDHRDTYLAIKRKSRLKLGSHPERFGGQREVILKRDNYQCRLCKISDVEHRQQFGRSLTIDHIDGLGRYSKIKNHSLDNLWTLCLSCHGRKDGKHKSPLTVEQVREIRSQVALGQASQAELSRRYEVSDMTISRIVRRIRWKQA